MFISVPRDTTLGDLDPVPVRPSYSDLLCRIPSVFFSGKKARSLQCLQISGQRYQGLCHLLIPFVRQKVTGRCASERYFDVIRWSV